MVVVGAGIVGPTAADELSRAGVGVRVLESRRLGSRGDGLHPPPRSAAAGSRHHDRPAPRHRRGAPLRRRETQGRRAPAGPPRRFASPVQERGARSPTPLGRSGLPTIEAEPRRPGPRGAGGAGGAAALSVARRGRHRPRGPGPPDPVPHLAGLADAVAAAGGHVHEQTRVVAADRVSRGDGARFAVRTDQGDLRARHVLMCTGLPRRRPRPLLRPPRARRWSYRVACGSRVGPPPDLAMAINVDSPTRSLRTAPDPAGGPDLLLVGGEGTWSGAARHRRPGTRPWWPGLRPTTRWTRWRRWSTQDYESVDELPHVGGAAPARRDARRPGFAKWGMTNGTRRRAGAGRRRARPSDPVLAGALTPAGATSVAPPGGWSSSTPRSPTASWPTARDPAAGRGAGEGAATVTAFGRTGRSCVDGEEHGVAAVCPRTWAACWRGTPPSARGTALHGSPVRLRRPRAAGPGGHGTCAAGAAGPPAPGPGDRRPGGRGQEAQARSGSAGPGVTTVGAAARTRHAPGVEDVAAEAGLDQCGQGGGAEETSAARCGSSSTRAWARSWAPPAGGGRRPDVHVGEPRAP